MTTLSVVVETGCAATATRVKLNDALAALARQTYPREDLEIIVVDTGDVLGLDAAVLDHLPAASILRLPGGRHYEMKNLGLRAATGQIIAFVDSDVMVVPNWAAQAVDTLRAAPAEVVGVQGRTLLAPGLWSRPATAMLYGLRLDRSGRYSHNLVANNCAFRGDFLRHTPFEQVHLFTTPDSILMARLRAAGARLVVNETMRATHDYHGVLHLFSLAYRAGRCMVAVRRADSTLPGSWIARAGPAGPLLLIAGKLLSDLRRLAANRRGFRVGWWEWIGFVPVALLFYLALLAGGFAAVVRGEGPPLHHPMTTE